MLKKIIVFGFIFLIPHLSLCREISLYRLPSGKKVKVAKNEILVKFKPNTRQSEKQNLYNTHGVQETKDIKKLGWVKIKIPEGKDMHEVIESYKNDKNVLHAEPNYIYQVHKLPNEYNSASSMASSQWGLEKIQAHYGWDIETGEDVVIAVIDTGVDLDHEDLDGNIWVNDGETMNGLDDDGNGYTDDVNGYDFVDDVSTPTPKGQGQARSHGTHVAGIAAAATDNSKGIAGVSWECKIMAVRTIPSDEDGSSDDIALGIRYAADNGADVINLSIGGRTGSTLIKNACDYAYDQGCFIAASSGNEDLEQVSYPAAYSTVMAVGATNESDQRCSPSDWGGTYGSNYGDRLDVVAPGNKIYSTVDADDDEYTELYDEMSGTSMAAPHVSGLGALVISFWEKDLKTWTPDNVRDVIISGCDDINSSGWDKYTGHGRINVYKTLVGVRDGIINIDEDKPLAYPNPFDPAKEEILIVLPSETRGYIDKVKIYSIEGGLVLEKEGSGRFATWDGRNEFKNICTSGLYFYWISTTRGRELKGKLTILR